MCLFSRLEIRSCTNDFDSYFSRSIWIENLTELEVFGFGANKLIP
jgi:hypothetical protein